MGDTIDEFKHSKHVSVQLNNSRMRPARWGYTGGTLRMLSTSPVFVRGRRKSTAPSSDFSNSSQKKFRVVACTYIAVPIAKELARSRNDGFVINGLKLSAMPSFCVAADRDGATSGRFGNVSASPVESSAM